MAQKCSAGMLNSPSLHFFRTHFATLNLPAIPLRSLKRPSPATLPARLTPLVRLTEHQHCQLPSSPCLTPTISYPPRRLAPVSYRYPPLLFARLTEDHQLPSPLFGPSTLLIIATLSPP
ncbi:hypothetical protein PGTUg99_034243 [Puccinia graminis f. sp. tritici]|uniref:Uncharacterized protein n=1 Tax=Puccinia graminis f. sp. tritici TaxID=56615 RepID=A0A5B0MH87_PUCGR|nr:hypothetical protein PGTUg99_034243 [Puccinia graminis f. sp. tritici]